MIGTATASLFQRSRAACPPRPKMLTRRPVLPKLRVGMAAFATFAAADNNGALGLVGAAGIKLCPASTAVITPPNLRNSRRFGGDFFVALFSLIFAFQLFHLVPPRLQVRPRDSDFSSKQAG